MPQGRPKKKKKKKKKKEREKVRHRDSLVAQHVRDLAIVAAVTWVHFLAQEIPHAAGIAKE